MGIKKVKVNYFYPIKKNSDGVENLVNLAPIFKGLESVELDKRIIKDGVDGNIQLKKIQYNSDNKRWELCFLKNRAEAPFITKLSDDTDTAEALDDDEFVGQECCLIYDEKSNIISMQNNRSSLSFSGVTNFINKFSYNPIYLSAIVYQDRFCEIIEEEGIEYKSVIIGYTDVTLIKELADRDDNEAIATISKIANNLSAINGKLEFGVGRSKSFLTKRKLKSLVNFFKKNNDITNTLKVKMVDNDTIRLIDLLNNKASDEIEISVTKEDPKTFDKILNSMNSVFDTALDETFEKCKVFVNA